jgi:hypothetical protein
MTGNRAMKMAAAILVSSHLLFGPNHLAAAANELTKEECLANHQRVPADTCMHVSKGGACSAKAILPDKIEVDIDGTTYSATVGRPFECKVNSTTVKQTYNINEATAQFADFVRLCRAYSRYDLNFGGLNRGMAHVVGQKPDANSGVLKIDLAEVYLNHDKTGNSYTKYTCRIRK